MLLTFETLFIVFLMLPVLSDSVSWLICVCLCECVCVRARACVCVCVCVGFNFLSNVCYWMRQCKTHESHLASVFIIFTNPSARAVYDTRSIFNRFEFRVFLLLDQLPHQGWRTQSVLLFPHSRREDNWIHTFPNAMWNAISVVQDLNSCRHVHFLWR